MDGVADRGSGPGVSLRRVRPEDAALVLSWREEPSARRYQPLRRVPLERLREMLAERAALPLSPALTGDVQWLIVAPKGPVGWVTLTIESREHGLGNVGYTIGERFRGRGYATAGLRAMLPLAFGADTVDLARLQAVAAVENTASRRVLERAGFVYEGTARAHLVIGGVRVDHACYALLRSDWLAGSGSAPSPEPPLLAR